MPMARSFRFTWVPIGEKWAYSLMISIWRFESTCNSALAFASLIQAISHSSTMFLIPTPSLEKLYSFKLSERWLIFSSAFLRFSFSLRSFSLLCWLFSVVKISCSIILWFKLLTFSNSCSRFVLVRIILARMSIFSSNILRNATALS